MKHTSIAASAWLATTHLVGCTGAGEVEYAGEVQVSSPELIAVSPGVQVVADADEPLFFSGGYYWLYRDDAWLRSDSYRGGFARIDVNDVPQAMRVIEEPRAYVHYRWHERRTHAREVTSPQRSSQPVAAPPYRNPQPGPAVVAPSAPERAPIASPMPMPTRHPAIPTQPQPPVPRERRDPAAEGRPDEQLGHGVDRRPVDGDRDPARPAYPDRHERVMPPEKDTTTKPQNPGRGPTSDEDKKHGS